MLFGRSGVSSIAQAMIDLIEFEDLLLFKEAGARHQASSVSLCLETRSLTEWEAYDSSCAGWPGSSQEQPVSVPHAGVVGRYSEVQLFT